jgi:2-polyprenyl-3-methyl-5-hydroxy-6-metoxy-1,4-benzoquinol methylase
VRPDVRADNPLEALAIRLNLAPRPVAESMVAMMFARAVMAGVRLGIFGRLAEHEPATGDELAHELGLDREGTRHLLQCLVAGGNLERDGDRYSIAKSARKWLDPRSNTYVGTFVDFNYDQWEWWSHLEERVRSGEVVDMHAEEGRDEAFWGRYIRGQYELARISAPEVAKALRLPDEPRALLDLAGGHGWFAAELCRRHEGMRATVVDLPQSAAVGRRIMEENGLTDLVEHREGDMFEADLGGPYDGALCFNIVHHLDHEGVVRLFRRVAAVLKPGGKLAVLDLFTPPGDEDPDLSAYLGMHFWLTSTAATYSPDDLRRWLRDSGFSEPRRVRIRRIPSQTLYEARLEKGV